MSSRSLARRASSSLPEGTASVGIGLVLSGLCAYAFLALAKRALPTRGTEAVQQLWFATFALAPGFFLPLEQEVARALSHRRALHQGGRPVVRKAAVLGGIVCLLLIVALAALSSVLTSKLFRGHGVLVVALMLAVTTWSAAHLGRGVLSGNNKFGPYGVVIGGDGVLRLVLCAGLLLFGIKNLGAWGFAVGVPPALALLIAFRGQRDVLAPGPEAPWQEVTSNLGLLLLGSVGAAFLVNAGPLVANAIASKADKVESARYSVGPGAGLSKVGAFAFGVLVSRIPLFMFQAVQAALLPKLSRLAAMGAFDEFRTGFRKLMGVVFAVAVAGALGALLLGPLVLRIAFKTRLSGRTLALLAIGAGVYMAAIAIAQALIALRGHPIVAAGWLAGVAALIAALSVHDELILRVSFALIIGPAVALAVFALGLRRKLSGGATIDADSLTEALHDLP